MKVYISCHHPDPARELAAQLRGAGHAVASTWHDEPERPAADDAAAWGKSAFSNLSQITGAGALVLIASPEHISGEKPVNGGKFVEAGYALNRALRYGAPAVITLGGVENGMLHHPAVSHAKDTAELLALLQPK